MFVVYNHFIPFFLAKRIRKSLLEGCWLHLESLDCVVEQFGGFLFVWLAYGYPGGILLDFVLKI